MKILRVFSFDHAVTKLADQLLHLDDHYIYFLIPVAGAKVPANFFIKKFRTYCYARKQYHNQNLFSK